MRNDSSRRKHAIHAIQHIIILVYFLLKIKYVCALTFGEKEDNNFNPQAQIS